MSAVCIYYDGHCPFCSRYASLVRLRRHGAVKLLNLRELPNRRHDFHEHGLDPDKGMIVEIDGRLYGGADAMHVLSLLDQNNSVAARLTRLVFSSRSVATVLYPLLRMGRNTLLLFLGRERLTSDTRDRARNELFLTALGVFCWLHLLVYAFQFGAPILPSTAAIGFLGFWLILRPLDKKLFVALIAIMAIDAWLQAPSLSNHTILKNFLLFGAILAGAWHSLRGNPFEDFMRSVICVSRWLLLIMYFFGVFHKINAGFLDPETSCSTALWSQMPDWLNWVYFDGFGYVTSWGTLIIETVIGLSLLTPQFRRFGILSGIVFHSLLALSDYALYATFSMLSLLLHLSFLSPGEASQAANTLIWKKWRKIRGTGTGILFTLAYAGLLYLLAWNGNYSELGLAWLILTIPLVIVLAIRPRSCDASGIIQLLALQPRILYVVPLLFFLNGFAPYLGLKTAQSMNMFANLRLEGGESNHYLIRDVGPFGYLDDVAIIEEATGSAELMAIARRDLGMVYYDLLDQLEREPQASVTFVRNGKRFIDQNQETLHADINRLLHASTVRKWFHFNVVDSSKPKPCALDR